MSYVYIPHPEFPLGARGDRPVFFPCDDLTASLLRQIPGVVTQRGGVACTLDAAPYVAQELGVAWEPQVEIKDSAADLLAMPGLEEFKAKGLGTKLRSYQKTGALFLARRAYALCADPMRCLAGTTPIIVFKGGKEMQLTLEELFEGWGYWGTYRVMEAESWDPETGEFFRNEILQVHSAGRKKGFRVETEDGDMIVASLDHVFYTDRGERKLRHLCVGDRVRTRRSEIQLRRITSIDPMGKVDMYDISMIGPCHNYVAGDFVVHNSGKTRTSIAAAVLRGAQKVLIVAPAIAKYVWAEEIAKVLGEEAVLLEGRAATTCRRFCMTCLGRGRLKLEDGVRVAREQGWDDKRLRPHVRKAINYEVTWEDSLEDPKAAWERLLAGLPEAVLPAFANRPHKPPKSGTPKVSVDTHDAYMMCAACTASGTSIFRDDECHQEIARARFVVINYELLVAQGTTEATGKETVVRALPGWADALSTHFFDHCIADELHMIRGFSTDQSRKGKTRRERFNVATQNIPVVWGLTGTPVFGFTRDLWGQLDSLSQGAMVSNGSRLPFTFHARWCEGHQGEFGWVADGRSPEAATEIPDRLKYMMIRRPRSVILSHMPEKVRQVYSIEPTSSFQKKLGGSRSTMALKSVLASTLRAKLPDLVSNIITEMAGDAKVVIFCLTRDNVINIYKAMKAAIEKPTNATLMSRVKARGWAVTGDVSLETRFKQSANFKEWAGSAFFISTIDAMQVGISLSSKTAKYPTQSVHFADLHWSPSAMVQAEDRPYEPGVKGMTIAYYIVKGSADEHIRDVVLPKVETVAKLTQEEGAEGIGSTFAVDEQESLNDLYARLLA